MAAEASSFSLAASDPSSVIRQAKAAGTPVVRTLGVDAPRELILAAGILPVRIVAPAGLATPRADRIMGSAAMGTRGKRLLEQLLDPQWASLPVLITHADAASPQLFAALRELSRLGEPVPASVHFLDLLHLDRPSSRRYNEARLSGLRAWLEEIGGRPVDPATLEAAVRTSASQAETLRQLAELRWGEVPRLSGSFFLDVAGSINVMPPAEHAAAMRTVLASAESLPPLAGRRLFLCGSAHDHPGLYRAIEACGAVIVGEDHDAGEMFLAEIPSSSAELASPTLRQVSRAVEPSARASQIAAEAERRGAEFVLHLTIGDDEAAPWDLAAIRSALPASVEFDAIRTGPDAGEELAKKVGRLLGVAGDWGSERPLSSSGAASKKAPAPKRGDRSRKSLASVASFGTYQREWFAEIRRRVSAGAPFAVVNANAPQEILRALDIPFVVNQWWASIVAAKQQSRRYLGLLRERDFPSDVEAYSSQGLAAAFDEDPEEVPWGGLPRPDFLHAVASSDPTVKIFAEWGKATNAETFIYERTVDPRWSITTRWWEALPDRWDETLEAERIDLMVEELQEVIATLEQATGQRFSNERFVEVMELVNEQEEYYRRTRDLIAATVPAPVGIVDTMPATMVPQWHRGTVWARDAARAFYEEVEARAEAGLGAVPHEKVRLMWVGRGMWSEMGFYQKWEESHGAVFVWSMYLALAADGYIRSTSKGRDPMRALAARFLTMGDELRMPSWAGPWHVHEAQTHHVDAAVAIGDADPFVVRALIDAGVPVLELGVDNFSREGADEGAIDLVVTRFIEGPAQARAEARLGGSVAAV
jgi:benzoyl-CoA reductase/2-hydroxyglutaryl-CoA dehydratase subunit BcrC/BadD/HgdB